MTGRRFGQVGVGFQAGTLDFRDLLHRQRAIQILADHVRFLDWPHRIGRRRRQIAVDQVTTNPLNQLSRKTTFTQLVLQHLRVLGVEGVVQIGKQCPKS